MEEFIVEFFIYIYTLMLLHAIYAMQLFYIYNMPIFFNFTEITIIMGTEYETHQAYLQALIDPDTEADFATVIGLRILTQVNICIPIPLQS